MRAQIIGVGDIGADGGIQLGERQGRRGRRPAFHEMTRQLRQEFRVEGPEQLLWVRSYETVEELRQALLAFRETYNEHWLIERHGHRSPAQFRHDQLDSQPMAA